jgi:hypothetical protein
MKLKLKRLNVDISMNCVLLPPLTTWAGFLGKWCIDEGGKSKN